MPKSLPLLLSIFSYLPFHTFFFPMPESATFLARHSDLHPGWEQQDDDSMTNGMSKSRDGAFQVR
jgi:hypothetical protein